MNFLKKNKWLLVVLLIGFSAYTAYKYAYKAHKTTEELNAVFVGNSDDFLSKVKEDFNAWNAKTVELTGEITAIDTEGISLNNQIYCQFNNIKITSLKIGQKITLKGIVIGYDDLLEELKLNNCILKNKHND